MKHEHFQLDKCFLTETGWWKVTDLGTRTVIAIKLDYGRSSDWYNGPPYAVSENVFDEYDFGGCFFDEKDYEKVMGEKRVEPDDH